MATLTRLASTLTARYFPSSSLTDAFYLDGRLCGKRETRQADITIDKDERGFFFSLFTHPTIEGFEPGTIPPFEPQLRGLCNEVKNGHKEIDAMIEKFLSTAVEVAGTTKLMDNEIRDPYFSGVIVRDSEAFAVTIGGGLAFLYRDDTMFPLTDAGIPMEPIDAYGNRVGDFQYYCSSKTANALWSNFFTLTPDDCIILCNKAIYDALGQREILRILTDAEDQCDAAGLILTQASARMPNTPMQISISFVESVTREEKKGLFGRKKKKDDYEEETHELLESTVEGGEVGAAAKAIADAGFVSLTPDAPLVIPEVEDAPADGSIAFGDKAGQPDAQKIPDDAPEFPDKTEPMEELSAEEAMRKIFGDIKNDTPSEPEEIVAEEKTESPFVFDITSAEPASEPKAEPATAPAMETISTTEFTPESDDSPTKPVTDINSLLFSADGATIFSKAGADSKDQQAKETSVADLKEEPVIPVVSAEPAAPVIPVAPVAPVVPVAAPVAGTVPPVVNKPDEIVFAPAEVSADTDFLEVPTAEETFDPYGNTSAQELKNTPPIVFGEDVFAPKSEPVPSEEVSSIPVPEYELADEKPELKEEDKLNVDFPVTEKQEPAPSVSAPAAPEAQPAAPEAPAEAAAPAAPVIEEVIPEAVTEAPSQDEIVLPFGNPAFTTGAEESAPVKADDIPQMPLYDSDNYNNPVNAVGSEQNVSQPFDNASVYGDYANADAQVDGAGTVPPYQPYGAEAFSTADQSSYGTYGNQTVDMQGGVPMDNNGYPGYGNGDSGYVPGYDQVPQGDYPQQGYQDPNAAYQDLSAGYQDPNAASQYYQQGGAQQESGFGDYSAQQSYGEDFGQTQASASSSASLDDEWFNNILGVDDSGAVYGGEQTYGYSAPANTAAQPVVSDALQQQAQSNNPVQTSYKPSGAGPNNSGRPQPGAPRTASSAGKGGNGGGKKMKLNRNGYMFIAFLAILVICIIIVISLIARGCSNKKPVESTPSSESTEETTPPPTTTTQATLPDASAPIGYFKFSDDIGYRTWWDLFHTVYNMDIEKNNDPKIAIILKYNKLDPATYTGPNSGDQLLLPPRGVITGEIPITFNAGGSSTGETSASAQTTQGEVNSSIHLT